MNSQNVDVTLCLVNLDDGTRIAIRNEVELAVALEEGLIYDETILFDTQSGKTTKARDFGPCRDLLKLYKLTDKNAHLGSKGWMLAVVGTAGMIGSVLGLQHFPIVDDERVIILCVIMGIVAAVTFVGYLVVSTYVALGFGPWGRKFIMYCVCSLVCFPSFTVAMVYLVNGMPDKSPAQEHFTEVVKMRHSETRRRGQKRGDNYSVHVKSWRPDLDTISISVSGANFAELKVGDKVTIRSKPGVLGYEWIE